MQRPVAKWPATVLALALAPLSWSCAVFHARALSPEQSANEFLARSLDDPRLKDFLETSTGRHYDVWPPIRWRFDDLAWVSFFYNPELEVARADWRVAQAGIETAAERPNPTLSVSPLYSLDGASGVSPWIVTPTIDVPIETAGKRARRMDVARETAEAASLDTATAVWRVRSDLRTALIDLAAARRREQVLSEQAAHGDLVVRMLRNQLDAGEVARTDAGSGVIDFMRSRLELGRAREDATIAQTQVATALGVPMREVVDLDYEVQPARAPKDLLAMSPDLLRRRALLARTELRAALAEYAASQAALQLEIAKQYPDIHLGPGYEFDQDDNRWGLGLSVELPVLNQNEGPIAEAEAARAAAASRFVARQADVLFQFDDALARLRVAAARSADADEMIALQTARRDSERVALARGAEGRMEVESAELALLVDTLEEIDADTALLRAVGRLEDSLQIPIENLPGSERTATAEPGSGQ